MRKETTRLQGEGTRNTEDEDREKRRMEAILGPLKENYLGPHAPPKLHQHTNTHTLLMESPIILYSLVCN